MSGVDGITAARRIREIDRRVLLIYISSHEDYMKELFEVEPFRFLSKPLDRKKFCRYFREACQRVSDEEAFFQFTFNKEMQKVSLKEIVYFESDKRVVYIYLKDGTVFHFYGKLNDVERKLVDVRQAFLRVHQSYLVNYDYVHKVNFGSVVVCFAGKEIALKISEDRQKEVRSRLRKP